MRMYRKPKNLINHYLTRKYFFKWFWSNKKFDRSDSLQLLKQLKKINIQI